MGVDHAEGVVREVQGVHVRDPEIDVVQAAFGGHGAGLVQDSRGVVDGGDVAFGDQFRQVCGDGARAAADVQDLHVGLQRVEQVGGRVGGRAPGVRAQYGLVVAVCRQRSPATST